MKQVITLGLKQKPPPLLLRNARAKYLIFDGTYFKHEHCLMVVMDNSNGTILNYHYGVRENYETAYLVFRELRQSGIVPKSITIDGNTSVIRALRAVWPTIMIQRCVTHIQRQGLAWLRRKPTLLASKDLRTILLEVTEIKTDKEKRQFLRSFQGWERKYGTLVQHLPSNHKVCSDLQRTRSLLIHALPDMFHYLTDTRIAKTTNSLEGYFSQLKLIYRQHRGLAKHHRQSYFQWYIYFKNNH